MHTALNQTLAALPDDTRVYVGFLDPPWEIGALILSSRVMSTQKPM